MNDPINRDKDVVDSMLAEYLGGDLPAERREEFEARIHREPALAAEVASLRETIQAMQSMTEEHGAVSLSRERTREAAAERRDVIRTALRHAAAIALAFVAGYFVRGGGETTAVDQATLRNGVVSATLNSQTPLVWERRAGEAYVKAGGNTDLGRSLIALSQIAQR